MHKFIASIMISLLCMSVKADIASTLNDFPATAILWDADKITTEINISTNTVGALTAQVNATNALHMAFFAELWAGTNNWDSAYAHIADPMAHFTIFQTKADKETYEAYVASADARIASNSNNLVSANGKIALNSNNLVTAFSYIANNSNRLNTANANIANVSNDVVSLTGDVTDGLALKLDITEWASGTNALWTAIGTKVDASTATNIALAVVASMDTNTLASVASRGDFAGTETISPLMVNAKSFGNNAGDDASGSGWNAFGDSAGRLSSGDYWGAYGISAGYNASGNGWGAYGYSAGNGAIWNNSHAFGRFAGYRATGNNRLYIDVIEFPPDTNYNAQTCSMIYGDDGDLYLGRPNKNVTARGTNLIVNCPITWYGEERTTWPTAGTSAPLAWTPISQLTTGAVVTVTPTTEKRIYQVSTSIPITLTNDLSQLNANCTTNFEWETWINYTSTNALATVWAGFDFGGVTPDLTVTGTYKIACSTACGTTVTARQTYPTVYSWVNCSMPVTANAAEPEYGGKAFLSIMGTAGTNGYFVGVFPSASRSLIRSSIFFGNNADKTNAVWSTRCIGFANAVESGVATTNAIINSSASTYTSTHILSPPSTLFSPAFKFSWVRSTPTLSPVTACKLQTKTLNEIEAKHADAGGKF